MTLTTLMTNPISITFFILAFLLYAGYTIISVDLELKQQALERLHPPIRVAQTFEGPCPYCGGHIIIHEEKV